MADNYDDVCSICGRAVNADTLYYCCPECHRTHREKRCNEETDKAESDTEKQLFNQSEEVESK